MSKISIYKNAYDSKGLGEIELDFFLRDIQEGKWQDDVLRVRTVKDKTERDELKKRVPMVTVAGTFSERKDKALIKHSGFICIDIDNVTDLNDVKSQVFTDDYVYSGFDSISGYGLCLIFKIKPKKHREAFAGICEYLFKKYSIICDPTSVNESRPRFISFDPHLHFAPSSKIFENYPEKQIEQNKIPRVIFAQNDFENIIKQIVDRNIDITGSYHEWLRIGFALSDKFGQSGRQYFHEISSIGKTYSSALCDRQYTACLRQKTGVTIGTLYYYAKQAGIETVSKETKLIAQTAQINKKAERNKDAAKESIKKEGIKEDASTNSIIDQVFDQNINAFSDDSLITKLELYLRQSYNLRRNIITRKIEVDGQYLDDRLFNDIWCDATKIFEKVTSEMLQRVINSSFTKDFNPFFDFFQKYKLRNSSGVIDKLFDCILSEDYHYTRYFGKKWIVSIISAIHGQHSPLMLVLSGTKQGTGKTEMLRRLLPTDLQPYYAESKLDAGKDDEILMTQKLIIMDDEMGGKSKKDELKIKELLSRQTFSLREPYGRNNVDLNRLAVLCGTTNNEDILNDPTGNRRILPIPVYAVNQQDYNKIDKVDLFMEAYNLYKSGFACELSSKDIELLNSKTFRFEKFSSEYELINKFFKVPENGYEPEIMSASEIKNYIETHSVAKVLLDRVGKEMHRLGFKQEMRRVNGKVMRIYMLQYVTPLIK